MATLTNTKIKDTYDGLLKTTDNDVIGASEKVITDGLGNASVLSIGTASASFSNSVSITGGLTASTGVTTGSVYVNDAIVHNGDTDTKIEFLNNQMKVTVGGTLAINTIATGTEFYQDAVINGLTIGKGNGSLSTNVAVGVNALDSVTSGVDNTAIGHSTMQNITQGIDNAAFGTGAMVSTTTGNNNTSIGSASLPVNTTGSSNTAVGLQAMQVNTTGGANTVVGMNALNDNTEGNRNTALGFGSGNGIITGSDNVHIGYNTTSGATNVSNEIVIGSNVTGNGSNTATYGDSNITHHYFTSGTVRIDSDSLQLVGATNPTILVQDSTSGVEVGLKALETSTKIDSTHTFNIEIGSGNDIIQSVTSSGVEITGNLAVDTNTLYVDAASNKTIFNNLIQIRDAGSYLHIGANTSDGSDNETLYITGGGDASGVRGAVISLAGNESGGNLNVIAGRETNAYINFLTGTASTERMRIDSSGNVGINESNPASGISTNSKTLHISHTNVASISLDNTTQNSKFELASLDISGGALSVRKNTSGATSGATELMRIDSSGNVTVKAAGADQARTLSLQGTNGASETYQFNLVADGANAAAKFMIGVGGGAASERMRIDSSGNVGIGESSARNARLLLNNAGSQGAPQLMLVDSGDSGKQSEIRFDSGDLIFDYWSGASRSERMRIDSSGTTTMIKSSSGASTTPLVVRNPGSTVVNTESKIFLSTVSGDDRGAYISAKITDTSNGNALILATNTAGSSPTERMRIDSSGVVDIAGGILELGQNKIDGSSDNLKISADFGSVSGSSTIEFLVDGSEKMRIDNSGRVGIGITNPADKLVVVGDVASTGSLKLTGNSSTPTAGAFIHRPASNELALGTASSERMRIDSSGNVGIGSSSPAGKFEVNTGGSTAWFTRTAGNSGSTAPAIGISVDSTKSRITSYGDGTTFFTGAIGGSASERMRITSGGDVLIGTQTANCGGAVSMHTHIKNDDFVLGITTGSGASKQAVRFANDTVAVGSINLSTTSTTYNTSSDYRLKENVVEMTGALDRVDALKPSRFNFIADPEKTVDGFLAHEVQAIVPEAVTGEKDAVDEEGNPIYQGIDQSKIVPLLVGAIKELRAEIETLKSQLNA